ncbi:hypothetical protein [Ruegeria arenilitoris]|uniref:hypothetical protein n=1 Tax=Ruegeria arenilitoris TaxID=1173585 RepID=UPI00147BB975|nr:hypothetical protein [Ruegeria arenilitoris]
MSCMRPFGLKCIAAILATQLYAVPAIAESISSGGFIVIGSKQLSLHLRSTHHVHRYYSAPKAHYPKAKVHHPRGKVHHHKKKPKVHYQKPKVYYVRPKKRHHRSARGFPNRHASPYHIPQNYGIQRRAFRFGW